MTTAYVHPSLHLIHVAGKGEGYQASAVIAAGQQLIREQAHVARSSSSQFDKMCAAVELADMLLRTCPSDVAHLVCSDEQIEMAMSYIDDLAHDVTFIGSVTRVERLRLAGSAACMQNNSFERMDRAGVTYMLLGFAMAKVNHSCNANSIFAPSSRVNALNLVAKRDIQLGEEVTLSYIQGEHVMTLQERRRRLLNGWCFCCACELCIEEAAHSARVVGR
jgi:hypothetical protein